MRFIAIIRIVAFCATASPCVWAESKLSVPEVTVGRNLEAPATVQLPDTASGEFLKLMITSDDPSRLLLSNAPDRAGSASIVVTALPQIRRVPPFWLQARGDTGTVTYTISGDGVGSAKGTVKVTPSAIVIIGPFQDANVKLTPRAAAARITVVSTAVDSEGKVEEQRVAGGSEVEVAIANSEPKVGKLRDSKLVLRGGSSFADTLFVPAAEGETTLAPIQPSGFQAAKERANVVVAIGKPGLAIETNVYLGKNLQLGSSVLLGEPAPPDGLDVTITSSDPSKLILSLDPGKRGSGSIQVHVPGGQFTAPYYLQALSDSGTVTCEGKAPGYRTRVGSIGLARSGIIVAYDPYGPPDEAAVLRQSELREDRAFTVSLDKLKTQNTKLVVWAAYLDPKTDQAADITIQALRPGVTAKVNLTSSDSSVGTVESPLTIESGKTSAISRFTALKKGVTVISIDTPAGFTTPKNATRIPANVRD